MYESSEPFAANETHYGHGFVAVSDDGVHFKDHSAFNTEFPGVGWFKCMAGALFLWCPLPFSPCHRLVNGSKQAHTHRPRVGEREGQWQRGLVMIPQCTCPCMTCTVCHRSTRSQMWTAVPCS